jgi:hypothetical protein
MCSRTPQDMAKLKVQASTESKGRGALDDARLERRGIQQTSDEKVIGNVLRLLVAGLPRRLMTK